MDGSEDPAGDLDTRMLDLVLLRSSIRDHGGVPSLPLVIAAFGDRPWLRIMETLTWPPRLATCNCWLTTHLGVLECSVSSPQCSPGLFPSRQLSSRHLHSVPPAPQSRHLPNCVQHLPAHLESSLTPIPAPPQSVNFIQPSSDPLQAPLHLGELR